MAWSEAQAVNGPCRGPHGAQRAAMVRRVVRLETTGNWTTRGKVSTGHFHGPQRTCLTWSKALDHSEEGERWRCVAHRHDRRRRSSTAVNVLDLQVKEQIQGLAKLRDLRTGREEG
jgi:hypothetical protein